MIPKSTLLSITAAAAASALLAGPASSQDLLLGSRTSAVHRAHAVTGGPQLVGLCGGQVQAMAEVDGVVYLGTPNGFVYSWSESAGGPTYAFDFPGDVRGMAAHAGDLLIGTADGTVKRVDPADGTVLATLQSGVPLESVLVDGGVLYVGSSFGAIQFGDPVTGGFQFFGTCGNAVLAMASDGATLFASDSGQRIWKFAIPTKQLTGSYAMAAKANALALFQGDLLAGGEDGAVRRLERQQGAVKASFANSAPVDALALLAAPVPGTVYCSGSGCPCSNDDPENACANSTGFGSDLIGTGSASVAADDLTLYAYDVPSHVIARYYMSQIQNAAPFGDGKLCAGGGGYPAFRFGVQNSGAGGVVVLGPGVVSFAQQNFGPSGAIHPGATWNFQLWFRDGAGPCGTATNTSPGYQVTFVP